MLAHVPLLAGLPGGTELWIVLIILLLLFGRRIPQVARSLGQGISQFKKGLSDAEVDDDDEPERLPPQREKSSSAKSPREQLADEDDDGR